MDNETSKADRYPPSRFLVRLLDRGKHIDYLIAFIIGAWPICLSILIGAHKTVEGYTGYLDSPNWWSLAFLFPAILFAFRWVMAKVAPVGSPQLSGAKPPIINILKDNAAKDWVYSQLRQRILSKNNIRITLLLVVIIHILDMWPVAVPYMTGAPNEIKNWSSMFLEGDISKSSNFILLIFAYSVQFSVAFLGTLTILLFLRHNSFFMQNIFQRRCTRDGNYSNFFQIDVNDVNRCFGFRIANEAFNTQVKALMIAGAAMFFSRYAHANRDTGSIIDLFNWPPVLPGFSFPLAGQWLMALFWLVALLIVAMPAFVKLLPRMPNKDSDQSDLSVENYLREFFSNETWPKDKSGKEESVAAVASKFARNSFWPTGDNRASVLFLFSYWIFFVILLPPVSFDFVMLLITFTVYGIAAYLLRYATFWALKWALRYVDEMLVVERIETPNNETESDNKSNARVFISYRRSDTAPYARSIHEHLLEHFYKENIFMDIEDIEPGVKFGQEIEKALLQVDAVIVLIGKEWVTVADENGNPRINDAKDMVRFEIAAAIKLGKRIFPVLVGGAKMPLEKELPDPLKELAQFNAVEISDHRWAYDLNLLVKALNATK